jgi:hypothetical protein
MNALLLRCYFSQTLFDTSDILKMICDFEVLLQKESFCTTKRSTQNLMKHNQTKTYIRFNEKKYGNKSLTLICIQKSFHSQTLYYCRRTFDFM